jgi:uncharacterized glyoxalase superfamily metalloenzyme YdcJ
MSELDPETREIIDTMLIPHLAPFALEMARKRAGGFDNEDLEDFVRDAVEAFEMHTDSPLDCTYGPYIVERLREAAGLPPANDVTATKDNSA